MFFLYLVYHLTPAFSHNALQFQPLYRLNADEEGGEDGGDREEHQQDEIVAVAEIVGDEAGEGAGEHDADGGDTEAIGVEHHGMVAPGKVAEVGDEGHHAEAHAHLFQEYAQCD